jgi:hypothetical protein
MSGFLEDLVPPQPFIAPHLNEPEPLHAFEGWPEISDNMLGALLIGLCVNSGVQEAARA